jgi:hypothetical protein
VEEASINPLALLFLVAMCLVVLCASRHIAVCAVLVTAAFIPLGQQFVFAGLHLYFLRILILAGVCRLLTRHEARGYKLETVDKLFVAWAMTGMICGILRGPSAETFGAVYDSLGVYFLIRILTRDATDILAHLKTLAVVSVAMAFCMAWETLSHHNVFHVLGGVPDIASERYERFRAQGPFRHAILAGTFGATLFPLMVGLWFSGGRFKRIALAGIGASLVITIASASSGPAMSLLTAMLGILLWPMRGRMRLVRRVMVLTFIGLTLVMNAPVWYLIGRVSELTGGTGWYRSFLIEQSIKHINEWWLIGSSETAHWSPWASNLSADKKNMDITNHYIIQGLRGGVAMLGLFLAIIATCFKTVGRLIRDEEHLILDKKLVWAFGIALACHCAAFISVSYFDQINVFWYWLLATIAALPRQSEHETGSEPISETQETVPEGQAMFSSSS